MVMKGRSGYASLDETDDDQGQRRAKNKQTTLLEALRPLKIK
jgi:hypothetical protein